MIQLAVIEDHDSLRNKLKDFFDKSNQIECVLVASSIEQFLKRATIKIKIDIILCDIGLPGISGIKGIAKIKKIHPTADVIMMTVHQEQEKIFNAICAGANGYLLKDFTLLELERQIINIQKNGGALLSPLVAQQILKYFNPKLKGAIFQRKIEKDLSKRELQIIQLLSDGLTYKEVASTIGIGVNGVRYHIKNIYQKLQVKTKTAMIKKFFQFFKK